MKYAIGDIHGCFNTLKSLLNKIEERDNSPEYIFLGDYIDRGNFNYETIDFLISLSKKNKCTFLLGNHDDIFNIILNNRKYTNVKNFISVNSKKDIISWFINHGLDKTFTSYMNKMDIDNQYLNKVDFSDTIAVIEHVFDNIPKEHKNFFESLTPIKIIDDFFFCHGWFPNQHLPRDEKFLKREYIEPMIWNSFPKDISPKDYSNWGMTGVFGHTPTSKYSGRFFPLNYGNIVLLDTGVCFNGKLSSFCVEEKSFLFVDVEKTDVA